MPKAKKKRCKSTIPGREDDWESEEFRALGKEKLERCLGLDKMEKKAKKKRCKTTIPGREDDWESEEFRALVKEKLERCLGLDKEKKKKGSDTVWYYPSRDPDTGLIPYTTKERKRKKKKPEKEGNEGPCPS